MHGDALTRCASRPIRWNYTANAWAKSASGGPTIIAYTPALSAHRGRAPLNPQMDPQMDWGGSS
jgi:hypothetical protein